MNRTNILNLCSKIPEELEPETLKNDMMKFIESMRRRHDDADDKIQNMLSARRVLEGLIVYLQNMIDPKNNTQVEAYKEEFYQLVSNIGRWNKKLDTTTTELITSYGATYERVRDRILYLKIKNYEQMLLEGMENIILRPLFYASNKYTRIKIDAEKTQELFGYFIFFNLVTTSFILGVVTREEKGIGKKAGVGEIIPPRTIPPLPEGINEMTEQEEEQNNNVENIIEGLAEEDEGV